MIKESALYLSIGAFIATGAALLGGCSRDRVNTLRLGDGTLAYFRSDTSVTPADGLTTPRVLEVDGQVLIITPTLSKPISVRSRLLDLTVAGDSALRLTAYSHQRGEQVEVLYGHVIARKSYPSSHPEPDFLLTGEMSMVNKDIDLMEKEKCDIKELAAWADATRKAGAASR